MPFIRVTLKSLRKKAYEFEPKTLGQHLFKRRLKLGLSQTQAAKALGVTSSTILNWEKGHTEPPIGAMPRVLRWLGYDPGVRPKSLPERLADRRRTMGWSIRVAARHVGVDPGTWGDWERGRVILYRRHRLLVAQLLKISEWELDLEMRSRWVLSHD